MPAAITRLAPSPTGALHLGNAAHVSHQLAAARKNGWKILLRIDDLDGPRIKPGAAAEALEDLRWLGIDFDDGPVYQTSRSAEYSSAIGRLLESGRAYPCVCTRKEVETASSAPHAEDGSTRYPGTCRDRFSSMQEARNFAGRPPAIRFRVPDEIVNWTDQFAGPQACDLSALGDFVIAKADGVAAYQLAVAVHDAAAAVTHVVRGDDLLDSTPRQMLLYAALNMSAKIPDYYHLPLVVGPDGRRLAKRHGDTRLSYFRQSGFQSGRLLSLLARWSSIDAGEFIDDISQLTGSFELARVPKTRITWNGSIG